MKKILFIEDEPMLAEMYKDKFEEAGFQVVLAFTAEEGLELTKKEKPDLVMLDILLPKGNGIFFLEKRKEDKELLKIPVIAFSNYDDPEAKKRAKELGAKAYLIKTDYTPQQIVEKIREYLK
jgi:DNA-binding response OmpR family regulator